MAGNSATPAAFLDAFARSAAPDNVATGAAFRALSRRAWAGSEMRAKPMKHPGNLLEIATRRRHPFFITILSY
jgi:hypothetical protein